MMMMKIDIESYDQITETIKYRNSVANNPYAHLSNVLFLEIADDPNKLTIKIHYQIFIERYF